MNKFKLHNCTLAEKHHSIRQRQFAHVFHKPGTICISKALYGLPPEYQAGILLHEIGHLAAQRQNGKHTEKDADLFGYLVSGIRIKRRAYGRAKRLEAINRADLGRAMLFLQDVIDLPNVNVPHGLPLDRY